MISWNSLQIKLSSFRFFRPFSIPEEKIGEEILRKKWKMVD